MRFLKLLFCFTVLQGSLYAQKQRQDLSMLIPVQVSIEKFASAVKVIKDLVTGYNLPHCTMR